MNNNGEHLNQLLTDEEIFRILYNDFYNGSNINLTVVIYNELEDEELLNAINESFNVIENKEYKEYNLDITETIFRSKTKSTCIICLTDFNKGNDVSIINCNCKNTLFHTECIKTWCKEKPECPLCRKNIEKKE